jgi:hypothetical protein
MHEQLWGYKVEDKLYLGVREQKMLNTAGIRDQYLTVLALCGDTGCSLFFQSTYTAMFVCLTVSNP